MSSGSVYVLANSSMPGLVKVGKTTRDPQERAAELSRHSGVPQPFRVVFSLLVADCDESERVVHNSLASRRANDDREFFLISIDDAVHTIKLHCIGVVVGTAAGRLSQTVTYSDPIRMPPVSTRELPNEQENQNELPILTTDDARIRPGDDVANRETLFGCLILISALVAGLFFLVRWIAS